MRFVDKTEHEMRMKIVRAANKLMERDLLNEISTAAICKEAGISRPTFYRYFADKFEIPQWHFELIASTYLYEIGRTLSWYEANYRNSLEVQKMRNFYIPAFKTEGFQSLVEHQRRRREEVPVETLTEYRGVKVDEELLFQIRSHITAETDAVSKWVLSGMPYDAARLAELIEGIIPRRLYELLNQPHPSRMTSSFEL